jgi:hypothetical protein
MSRFTLTLSAQGHADRQAGKIQQGSQADQWHVWAHHHHPDRLDPLAIGCTHNHFPSQGGVLSLEERVILRQMIVPLSRHAQCALLHLARPLLPLNRGLNKEEMMTQVRAFLETKERSRMVLLSGRL